MDPKDLAKAVINGDRRALAKAITLVEGTTKQQKEQAVALLDLILPQTGNSIRIGISGIPGVGKSTFIESFGLQLACKDNLAVLTVDPSSETGRGAILGDKTRMVNLSRLTNVFIRPSPSGLASGGVALRTREAILLCEAAGFKTIFVETVGVGQSESMVRSMVDIFILLQIPRAGDELQGIKRGILELVDIICVTKADGDNLKAAQKCQIEMESSLGLLRGAEKWIPPVLLISSTERTGLDNLEKTIKQFKNSHASLFEKNRKDQAEAWFDQELSSLISAKISQDPHLKKLVEEGRHATRNQLKAAPKEALKIINKLFKD